MSELPIKFTSEGRTASVNEHDTGALLTWSEGGPVYYEQVRDALLYARLWAFHSLRPTSAKTLTSMPAVVSP